MVTERKPHYVYVWNNNDKQKVKRIFLGFPKYSTEYPIKTVAYFDEFSYINGEDNYSTTNWKHATDLNGKELVNYN